MNHWKETAEILTRLAELKAAGRRAALATVVHIVGSAYRRPGAKFLIEETGDTLGSVSGGCLEADVREVAKRVLETGAPSLRHYRPAPTRTWCGGSGWGATARWTSSCRRRPRVRWRSCTGDLRQLLAGDSPVAVAHRGGRRESERRRHAGAGAGRHRPRLAGLRGARPARRGARGGARCRRAVRAVQTLAGRGVFCRGAAAAPHLLVCGAGDDARPLVAYAADAGFRVTVFDHRPALLAAEWFPQAAQPRAGPSRGSRDRPASRRPLAGGGEDPLAGDRPRVGAAAARGGRALRRHAGAARADGEHPARDRTSMATGGSTVRSGSTSAPTGRGRWRSPSSPSCSPSSPGASRAISTNARRPSMPPDRDGPRRRSPARRRHLEPDGEQQAPLRAGRRERAAAARRSRAARRRRSRRWWWCSATSRTTPPASSQDLPLEWALNPLYEQGINSSLKAGILAVQGLQGAGGPGDAGRHAVRHPGDDRRHDRPLPRRSTAPLVISDYDGVNAPPMVYDQSLFAELLTMEGEGCGRQVVKRHKAEAEVLPWPAAALTDSTCPRTTRG